MATRTQKRLWDGLQSYIKAYREKLAASIAYQDKLAHDYRLSGRPTSAEELEAAALAADAQQALDDVSYQAGCALQDIPFASARRRTVDAFVAYVDERVAEAVERDGWVDYDELSANAQAEIERLGRAYDDFARHTLFATRSGPGWKVFVIEDSLVSQAENQPGFYDTTFRVRFPGE